tara:strand:- start:213 stop:404 length:192 start_codon:yes stop_codon:yes gene_type:complete
MMVYENARIVASQKVSDALKKNKAIVIINARMVLLRRFIKKLIMSATTSPSWITLEIFLEDWD